MRLRRSAPEVVEDNVRCSVRLEGYAATRVPRCASSSGLPRSRTVRDPATALRLPPPRPVKLELVPAPEVTAGATLTAEPPAIDVAFVERRLEHRDLAAMPIAAARRDGFGETALGETVNVSSSGLQVVMDHAADGDDLDVLVGPRYSVALRGKLIDQRCEERGHVWHLFLLEAGPDWHALVDELS